MIRNGQDEAGEVPCREESYVLPQCGQGSCHHQGSSISRAPTAFKGGSIQSPERSSHTSLSHSPEPSYTNQLASLPLP